MAHNPDFPDVLTSDPHPNRNVIDHYKAFSDSFIRDDLFNKSFDLEVIAENFAYDFNIATLVRNANAFKARKVWLTGNKRWDRRGAVGTHNYTPVEHVSNAESFYKKTSKNRSLIVIDNIESSVDLFSFTWPTGPVSLVFGQESIGVSNLVLKYAHSVVSIPQQGSVRSLNVGTSSGILLYEFMRFKSLT
jgi:tRNA G18 (ribose-2'-O)-methylase SpoU